MLLCGLCSAVCSPGLFPRSGSYVLLCGLCSAVSDLGVSGCSAVSGLGVSGCSAVSGLGVFSLLRYVTVLVLSSRRRAFTLAPFFCRSGFPVCFFPASLPVFSAPACLFFPRSCAGAEKNGWGPRREKNSLGPAPPRQKKRRILVPPHSKTSGVPRRRRRRISPPYPPNLRGVLTRRRLCCVSVFGVACPCASRCGPWCRGQALAAAPGAAVFSLSG